MSSTSISVVVSLYNERPALDELCSRLTAVLSALDLPYEIIFIDDGSTDRSIEKLREFRSVDRSVRYIRFRRNFGKSAALAAGFRAARYDTIATLDADLQDIPEQLPMLLDELDQGYDLVSGWRYHRRDKLSRRIGSKIYNRVTSALTGVRLHDINCGFKCYRREVLDEVIGIRRGLMQTNSEQRLRNLMRDGDSLPNGQVLADASILAEAFEAVERIAPWPEEDTGARGLHTPPGPDRSERRTSLRGVGMAATVWLTSPLPGTATVRLDDDGTICVVTAATENGSGAVSMGVTQIVAEEIGVGPEDVRVTMPDTSARDMTPAPRDRGRRTSSGVRPGRPRPR